MRIGPDIFATAKERLDEIARARGFEGRLMVEADGTLAAGDCRIEWSEGGVTRDRGATLATISDVVARYIAARNADAH